MDARPLTVAGSFVFTPRLHKDARGFFVSPLQEAAFGEAVGHPFRVAQTNHIVSAKGVLRGIHFTATPPGQAKYVHCAHGAVLDVVVDLREGSPTFGTWDCVQLDADSCAAVYLPLGVGHAYMSLAEGTVMSYLVSTSYQPALEKGIHLFDPSLRLPWPRDTEFIVSERDRVAPSLTKARQNGLLPRYADCLAAEPAAAGTAAAAAAAEASR